MNKEIHSAENFEVQLSRCNKNIKLGSFDRSMPRECFTKKEIHQFSNRKIFFFELFADLKMLKLNELQNNRFFLKTYDETKRNCLHRFDWKIKNVEKTRRRQKRLIKVKSIWEEKKLITQPKYFLSFFFVSRL